MDKKFGTQGESGRRKNLSYGSLIRKYQIHKGNINIHKELYLDKKWFLKSKSRNFFSLLDGIHHGGW